MTTVDFHTAINLAFPNIKDWCGYLSKGNNDVRDELLAQTLLVAAEKHEECTRSTLLTWMCGIAKNKSLRIHGSGVYFNRSDFDSTKHDGVVYQTNLYDLKRLEKAIDRAISTLTKKEQQIIQLAMQGMKPKGIAALNNGDRKTVKVHLARGRGKIKKQLTKYSLI